LPDKKELVTFAPALRDKRKEIENASS